MKTKKPTGDGICPPEIQHSHYIDGLINERAGTCDLGDSDFNDVDGNKTEPSTDDDDMPTAEPRVAVAHSSRNEAPLPRCTAREAAATELLNSLSNAFDPAVQRACDEDRASCSLANTQLLTLSQQLRDAQACNDKLRGQLFDLRNHLHESQHVENLVFLILNIHFLISDSRSVYDLIFYAIHITHHY